MEAASSALGEVVGWIVRYGDAALLIALELYALSTAGPLRAATGTASPLSDVKALVQAARSDGDFEAFCGVVITGSVYHCVNSDPSLGFQGDEVPDANGVISAPEELTLGHVITCELRCEGDPLEHGKVHVMQTDRFGDMFGLVLTKLAKKVDGSYCNSRYEREARRGQPCG